MYLDIPMHDKGKIRNILKSFEMFSPNLEKYWISPHRFKGIIFYL